MPIPLFYFSAKDITLWLGFLLSRLGTFSEGAAVHFAKITAVGKAALPPDLRAFQGRIAFKEQLRVPQANVGEHVKQIGRASCRERV